MGNALLFYTTRGRHNRRFQTNVKYIQKFILKILKQIVGGKKAHERKQTYIKACVKLKKTGVGGHCALIILNAKESEINIINTKTLM